MQTPLALIGLIVGIGDELRGFGTRLDEIAEQGDPGGEGVEGGEQVGKGEARRSDHQSVLRMVVGQEPQQ
ncbi:MAG TPA: hypothetical protein VEQ67_15220, partial [Mycobacterium sp.]|nr:hypothetical protein [Mycobacterium sp.]